MPIEWARLYDYKSPAFQWTLLFIIYLLSNILVQGWGSIAFAYTMVYTCAFLLIAITISKATAKTKREIGGLFAIMTLFVGMMTWVTSGAYVDAEIAMGITAVFTVLALLNEYGVVEAQKSVNNKYCLLGALGGIFLFGLLYFLHRLGILPIGMPPTQFIGDLPWYTVLNHLGVTLLAGADMLLIFGLGKWEKWEKARWLFFAMIVIGALAMLQAGFGLAIL